VVFAAAWASRVGVVGVSGVELVLGYRPFLDPLDLHTWWWLTLVPMALGISMGYKAVRVRPLAGYWRHVGVMTVQVVGGMIGLAAVVFVLIEVLAPMLGG